MALTIAIPGGNKCFIAELPGNVVLMASSIDLVVDDAESVILCGKEEVLRDMQA